MTTQLVHLCNITTADRDDQGRWAVRGLKLSALQEQARLLGQQGLTFAFGHGTRVHLRAPGQSDGGVTLELLGVAVEQGPADPDVVLSMPGLLDADTFRGFPALWAEVNMGGAGSPDSPSGAQLNEMFDRVLGSLRATLERDGMTPPIAATLRRDDGQIHYLIGDATGTTIQAVFEQMCVLLREEARRGTISGAVVGVPVHCQLPTGAQDAFMLIYENAAGIAFRGIWCYRRLEDGQVQLAEPQYEQTQPQLFGQ
jgi:hypothetical protein